MQNITFTINMGANNLEYVKLLLTSLERNLDSKNHQIIVFIDADNENSLEYLLNAKARFNDLCIIYNKLDIPVGYQRNKTILTKYAKYDIVSYLQSDMVVGPHYDTEILKDVKRGRILSSTRVEPPLHGPSPVTVTRNFGLHPSEFNLTEWNEFSNSIKRNELLTYFFAPFTYYKDDWMALDGYDTVFRRAREDSDLLQRCLHAGIELVQTFSANVYHFTCVTSRGNNWFDVNNSKAKERVELQKTADNIEVRRFLRKWGSFNHGESKLFKLDMDLVVKNYKKNFHIIEQIEPFFSRVWVESSEDKNTLVEKYTQYQSIANKLLGSTDESWEKNKHLFRVEDFKKIFNVGEPEEFSIKIELDVSQLTDAAPILSVISNLYDLLKDYDSGVYSLGNAVITINKVKVLDTPIVADNPEFDYNVLTIH